MLGAIIALGLAVSAVVAMFLYAIVRQGAEAQKERQALLDRIQAPDLAAIRAVSDLDRLAPPDTDVDAAWLSQNESVIPWDADLAIGQEE